MKDKSRARISSSAAKAAVIAALVIVIASFAGSAYMKRDVAVSSQKQARLETELITLQPSGFEPGEIRRPQGAFVLGVDNRAGVESIELQFMRVDGQRLNALKTPKRKVSWREVVDLPPGEYVLSVADHPEWTCNVTITPR